jgi:hypothetical protein
LSLYHITKQDSRYWVLCRDFTLECIRLDCFFITEPGRDLLMCLDQALQHRSVSVTSDEPLCISTLLGLDISQVLKYSNHDDRMEETWTLVSEKFRGMPAGVAFFEDNTLPSQGWRWTPRSLLPNDNSSITTFQRTNRWHQGKSAVPTSSSLRVKSSGFLLKQKHYRNGLPLHPWPGVPSPDSARDFLLSDIPIFMLTSSLPRSLDLYIRFKHRNMCGPETRAESCSVMGTEQDLQFITVFEASSGAA